MTAHDEPPAQYQRDGEHEHLDGYCVDALRDLYLYLDRELSPEAIAVIEAHLEECSPCLEKFDFEAELRAVIVSRSAVDAPPEVIDRLRGLLDSIVDSAGGPSERDG